MTVFLQWLVEHVWALYPLCAIGFIYYIIRALLAQQERGRAQFTLEREAATSRVVQALMMALVFVVVGVLVFSSVTFIVPSLGITLPTATPTAMVDLNSTTSVVPITPTPTQEVVVPTFTPVPANEVPTPPPPEPTEAPVPESIGPISGEVNVRFGDFAALVSYGVPATDVTTAEPFVLTLQWQGLEGQSPVDYLVFTHMYSADGQLIAQHDGPPADGASPITGWEAGQRIIDVHPMVFVPEFTDYVGSATIAVGLWDPASGRVAAETGSDSVVLPLALNIVPQNAE